MLNEQKEKQMARKKKEEYIPENEEEDDKDDIDRLLEAGKDDHYNFQEEVKYTTSTGSLTFDTWLSGGLGNDPVEVEYLTSS